jgi:hypothetical protein
LARAPKLTKSRILQWFKIAVEDSCVRPIAVLLLSAVTVCFAQESPRVEAKREDPWAKVHDIKSGTELRIIRKDSRQPVLAVFEDLNEDALIVATKKEEIGIPKDQIERIDARPAGGSRMNKETHTSTTDSTLGPPTQNSSPVPTTSTSSGVMFGGKPDFVTVYRATSASLTK